MRILIIRPGALGDTLLAFPLIRALRMHYNNPYITLVGNAAVLPLALASGLVDEASDYGHLQWSELFSVKGIHTPVLQKQLQGIELAICWLRDPGGVIEQNLRLAGVQRVIVAPGRPPEGKRIHIIDYLAETVGMKEIHGELIYHVLQMRRGGHVAPPPHPVGRDQSGPYDVVIHPGSGATQKCWPAGSFAAVIEYLWQHHYSVLLLAGPADHERIDDIKQNLSPEPRELDVLIDAPLMVVAEQLQQCRCYLGNDSGISHLAAMLGISTVVLFGPSDPAIWRPPGPYVEVLQAPLLKHIPVNVVIECILRFLVTLRKGT